MRWIAADTETTGFGPTAKVVEIALAEVGEDMQELDALASYINPEMPIPPSASAVHHITDSMVSGAPTIEEFFSDMIWTQVEDVTVIAHNAAFDMQYLAPHFKPGTRSLCTLRLVRHLYPELENHKLQTLRYAFDLDAGRAHSADGDTTVLVSLLQHVHRDKGLTLNEMFELAGSRLNITKMPFGKHKGQLIVDLPKSYVRWALDNMASLDDDHRAALEAVL